MPASVDMKPSKGAEEAAAAALGEEHWGSLLVDPKEGEDAERQFRNALLSEPDVTFKTREFCFQMVMQLGAPFTVIIGYFVYGRIYLDNMFLLPKLGVFGPGIPGFLAMVFFQIHPFIFWGLVSYLAYYIVYAPFAGFGGEHQYVFICEVLVALVAIISHRFMVAVKYAYMPQEFLDWHKTRPVPGHILLSLQILSGFMVLNSVSAERELLVASAHEEVELDKLYFSVPSCDMFCSSQVVQQIGVGKHVKSPAMQLAKNLLKRFADPKSDYSLVLKSTYANLFALLLALMPTFAKLGLGISLFSSPLNVAVSVACLIMAAFFTSVCTAFTFAGVSDFDRQLHMLRMMGDMMHDGHASNRTGNNRNKSSSSGTGTGKDGEALMQRKSSKQANMLGHLKVDLTIISNITSWHAVRVVLHRFGTTFRNRMMMNTSYVVMVSILLLVWLVAVTFSNVDNPDALLSIFIRCSQVIVWALFFLLYLLQNIFKGYLINREYLNHAHQLRRSHIAFNAYVAEEEIQMKTQELGLASSAADEANHLNSAVGRRLIKRQQQQREELEAAVLPGTVVVDHDHKGKDIDSLRIVSADAESTAITATETTVTPLEVEPVQVIGAAMSLAERELFILKLKHAMALLRALAESLTIDYETVPQKLLGIPCSIQLISAMLSVTATALAAIASVLGQAFSEQM